MLSKYFFHGVRDKLSKTKVNVAGEIHSLAWIPRKIRIFSESNIYMPAKLTSFQPDVLPSLSSSSDPQDVHGPTPRCLANVVNLGTFDFFGFLDNTFVVNFWNMMWNISLTSFKYWFIVSNDWYSSHFNGGGSPPVLPAFWEPCFAEWFFFLEPEIIIL